MRHSSKPKRGSTSQTSKTSPHQKQFNSVAEGSFELPKVTTKSNMYRLINLKLMIHIAIFHMNCNYNKNSINLITFLNKSKK